jgi:hypothetical protein
LRWTALDLRWIALDCAGSALDCAGLRWICAGSVLELLNLVFLACCAGINLGLAACFGSALDLHWICAAKPELLNFMV